MLSYLNNPFLIHIFQIHAFLPASYTKFVCVVCLLTLTTQHQFGNSTTYWSKVIRN